MFNLSTVTHCSFVQRWSHYLIEYCLPNSLVDERCLMILRHLSSLLGLYFKKFFYYTLVHIRIKIFVLVPPVFGVLMSLNNENDRRMKSTLFFFLISFFFLIPNFFFFQFSLCSQFFEISFQLGAIPSRQNSVPNLADFFFVFALVAFCALHLFVYLLGRCILFRDKIVAIESF